MAPLEILMNGSKSCKITKLKVNNGSKVSRGSLLLIYVYEDDKVSQDEVIPEQKLKSQHVGTVQEILVKEGDVVKPGSVLMRIARCSHPTVMKLMCAECGEDLRKEDVAAAAATVSKETASKASVAMVHSIPELHVSHEEAAVLAKQDEDSLIRHRKLVLLVDLDQTLIHTTLEEVPADMKDVHHFQLRKGPRSPWYHTRIRDGYRQFLERVSQYYQLHIFTMGVRLYAHTVAEIIDPEGKFFSHRILSRDECFDQNSKTANLNSIFPRGDKMVCIIDDRDDVWNFAPNLIHVPAYRYFEGTGDINTPANLGSDTATLPLPKHKDLSHAGKPQPPSNVVGDKKPQDAAQGEKEACSLEEEGAKKPESEVCSAEVSSTTKDSEEEREQVTASGDTKANVEGEDTKASEDKEKEMEEGELPHDKESENDPVSTTEGKETEAKPEEETDDYLMHLTEILLRIHRTFFKQVDAQPDSKQLPDLKSIIPAMRQSVLHGCNIVFSSVFPRNMPPEQSRAWKIAVALGASVSAQIMSKSKEEQAKGRATTHLIAAKAGTSKVHMAKRCKSIVVVEPDWLWSCWERWERVDERLFLLADASKGSSRCSTPGFSDTESTSSQKVRKGNNSKGKSISVNGKPQSTVSPASRTKSRPLSMSEDYNPMYSFSSEDLASMDREVEDIVGSSDEDSSSSSSSDSEQDADPSSLASLGSVTRPVPSSSDESLTAENPRGWKRKRDDRESDNDNDNDDEGFDPFVQCSREDSSSSAGISEEEWFSDEEGEKMANTIDDLMSYKRSVRKWDDA